MSVSAHQKNYLADKKPFFKHFRPTDVTITAVRSVAIQGLMVFNNYVAALELEFEDSDEDSSDADDADDMAAAKKVDKPEFVAPSLEEFGAACTKSFVKSMSITTFLRSLEEVSLRWLRPQVVSKLIKGGWVREVLWGSTRSVSRQETDREELLGCRCEQVGVAQVRAHVKPLQRRDAYGEDRHAREHPEPLRHLPGRGGAWELRDAVVMLMMLRCCG